MRKMVFLPAILALCFADFSAFGASRRSGPTGAQNVAGVANATGATNTTSVRAARTQKVVVAPNRAAVSRSAVSSPVTTTKTPTAQQQVSRGRAGTTQKVINLGTKVQAATENTVVTQECQDAYYGCMDAFCMLDNASGGRCQCSDRNADLDLVLEEIMKLDEQSYAMATEGVERLQMGENADAIMARAKAAADSVSVSNKNSVSGESGKSGGKTVRTLDLSAWRNNSLFDDSEDSVFGEGPSFESMQATLADKSGDDLQNAASKICVEKIPTQCKDSGSFLQLTYAQKIKSDCTAYENSLKQQRTQSAEKLQTAQKALRDAALEMYQNENKYDLGECVLRFKQCLQTTGECGDDFGGCVADTTILDSLYGKKSNKIATTTIKTGATSIRISSATYDVLNSKKLLCESVTKQCVNANKKDAVWNQVIKDIAPVIYSAEYSAASNNRMNCINTVVKCVHTACGSQWDEKTDNFDACLSDPNSINNYCALEYNRCGDDGTLGNVKSYIMAKLAAMKVDKCTSDVKACLLSEDHCGPDYAECIGLDSDTILDMCDEDLLVSCQDRSGKGANGENMSVSEYVARVAKGIALSIDNKFAVQCQNAADAAMERICGDSEEEEDDTCPGLTVADSTIDTSFQWQYCKKGQGQSSCTNILTGVDTLNEIKQYEPRLNGLLDVSRISFNANATDGNYFYIKGSIDSGREKYGYTDSNDTRLKNMVDQMNNSFALSVASVENDTTVQHCKNGRELQTFSARGENGERTGNATISSTTGRFSNMLSGVYTSVGDKVWDSVLKGYNSALNTALNSKTREDMRDEIDELYAKLKAESGNTNDDDDDDDGNEDEDDFTNGKYVIAQCRTTKKHMDNRKNGPLQFYSTPIALSDLLSGNNGYIECRVGDSGKPRHTINKCFAPCGEAKYAETDRAKQMNKLLSGIIPEFCAGNGYPGDNLRALLFSEPKKAAVDGKYTAQVYTQKQVDKVFEKIDMGQGTINNDGTAATDEHNCRTYGTNWYWYLLAFKLEDGADTSNINRDSSVKATLYKHMKIGK